MLFLRSPDHTLPTRRGRLIVFLDIDGVLNRGLVKSSVPSRDIVEQPCGWMDRLCLARFNAFCQQVEALLVISSSWRMITLHDTQQALSGFHLFSPIIGQTPDLGPGACRGDEIAHWRHLHPEYCDIPSLILDDVDDMLAHQRAYFVQTDPWRGFDRQVHHDCVTFYLTLNTLHHNKEPLCPVHR